MSGVALTVHGFLAGLCRGQSVQKCFQCCAFFGVNLAFQRVCQRTFQAAFPACAQVMQVGSPAGQFAGQVDLNALGGTDDANHLAFGLYFAAAYARPLGNMFHALCRFLGHLYYL